MALWKPRSLENSGLRRPSHLHQPPPTFTAASTSTSHRDSTNTSSISQTYESSHSIDRAHYNQDNNALSALHNTPRRKYNRSPHPHHADNSPSPTSYGSAVPNRTDQPHHLKTQMILTADMYPKQTTAHSCPPAPPPTPFPPYKLKNAPSTPANKISLPSVTPGSVPLAAQRQC